MTKPHTRSLERSFFQTMTNCWCSKLREIKVVFVSRSKNHIFLEPVSTQTHVLSWTLVHCKSVQCTFKEVSISLNEIKKHGCLFVHTDILFQHESNMKDSRYGNRYTNGVTLHMNDTKSRMRAFG